MFQPSRTRRILKWTGIGVLVLIPAVWIASVFAGVRIVTPVGSIAIFQGTLEIAQSPPMAKFAAHLASTGQSVKQFRDKLRQAEEIPAHDEDARRLKSAVANLARMHSQDAERYQAFLWSYWGIPIAVSPDQTMGIMWLKQYGPRLTRTGLGIRLPMLRVRSTGRNWPGVWIPLWVIAIPVAVAWGVIRWRRRPILPGHCTTCGYDLTGNTSGVCSECGEKARPPAGLAYSEGGRQTMAASEKSGR